MNLSRLCVFVLHPYLNQASPRLVDLVVDRQAVRVLDDINRQNLNQAATLDPERVQVSVRVVGDKAAAARARYAHRDWDYQPAGEGPLGEQMLRVAEGVNGPILFVLPAGPAVPPGRLDAALTALGDYPVAIGAAAEGAIGLLGLRGPAPELLKRITALTSAVEVRALAERLGLKSVLLPPQASSASSENGSGKIGLPDVNYHPANIAMTGATGSLGRHFLRAVLAKLPSTHVTAVIRSTSDNFRCPEFQRLINSQPHRITLIDADLSNPKFSPLERRQLVEADGGLWHFAASTNLHAASAAAQQKIRDINEGGTFGLLRLLQASDRPGPLFYVSTAYVCGRRKGVIYEHDLAHDLGFRNTYEQSKNTAELQVRAALDSGLEGAVFRPSLVVSDHPGPGPAHIAEVLVNAFQAAAQRRIPLTLRVPPGTAINAVYDEWCIRALLSLAPFSRYARTYHLTARSEVTMQRFVAAASSIIENLDVRLVLPGEPVEVTMADRLADRMMAPFKPYFDGQVQFDRQNLELDAPDLAQEAGLDPLEILQHRAASPLGSKIA